MMKKLKQKVDNRRAFTLAETLVAILILLMVSSIVAAGMPAARDAYEKIVTSSNAEMLMSTTISTLRNELGVAENVEVKDKSEITYLNKSLNATSKIYKDNNTIMFKRFEKTDLSAGNSDSAVPLISQQASAKLTVTFKSVDKADNGCIEFTKLEVKKGDDILTSRPTVSIRLISD